MPRLLLGGAAGIRIAAVVSGLPLELGVVNRLIVLVCMLAGLLVSGILIVIATASIGWIIGSIITIDVRKTPAS